MAIRLLILIRSSQLPYDGEGDVQNYLQEVFLLRMCLKSEREEKPRPSLELKWKGRSNSPFTIYRSTQSQDRGWLEALDRRVPII